MFSALLLLEAMFEDVTVLDPERGVTTAGGTLPCHGTIGPLKSDFMLGGGIYFRTGGWEVSFYDLLFVFSLATYVFFVCLFMCLFYACIYSGNRQKG